jgi:hypothetical protein
MKKLLCLAVLVIACLPSIYAKNKLMKINVEPVQAAIYVNNTLMGYGYVEIVKPKKNEVAILSMECEGYKPLLTKIYGNDKRESVSYALLEDGFYRSSASSGIVNKFFTVDIDPRYYTIENGKIDSTPAWKMIHQILLNYFDEVSATDYYGGYLQTPWQYKTFNLSEKR